MGLSCLRAIEVWGIAVAYFKNDFVIEGNCGTPKLKYYLTNYFLTFNLKNLLKLKKSIFQFIYLKFKQFYL